MEIKTKPNDLRLGNFIQDIGESDKHYVVTELSGTHIVAGAMTLYPAGFWHEHYIPLTPEWVEKFGFKKSTGKYAEYQYYSIDELGSFPSYIDVDGNFHWFSTVIPNVSEIKYVHQLQNLYFALTGTELTLKP